MKTNLTGITAVYCAIEIAKIISDQLREDIVKLIPDTVYTEDFWMDRFTPEVYFAHENDLYGYVYRILINESNKIKKQLS